MGNLSHLRASSALLCGMVAISDELPHALSAESRTRWLSGRNSDRQNAQIGGHERGITRQGDIKLGWRPAVDAGQESRVADVEDAGDCFDDVGDIEETNHVGAGRPGGRGVQSPTPGGRVQEVVERSDDGRLYRRGVGAVNRIHGYGNVDA